MADRYDLIVLGAGVGGAEVASQAAGKGFDVLAIEQRLAGGECPYWGCIPSNAMTRATGALGEAVRVGQLAGESAVEPDWTVLASRVAEASEHWDDTRAAARLERRGATLLRAAGGSWAPRRSRSAAAGGPPDGSHLPVPDVQARRPRRAPPAGLIEVSPPAGGRGPAGRPRRVSPGYGCWQCGQKLVPRPATFVRIITVPHTRQGWPCRRNTSA